MYEKVIRLGLVVLILIAGGFIFPVQVLGEAYNNELRLWLSQLTIKTETEATALPADVLVIMGGTLIDGTGRPPIPNGLVAVKGERILAAGPATDFAIPNDAQIVDVGSGTILPGLINAHVHNTQTAETRGRFLAAGIISTCDMATSIEEMAQFNQTVTERGQPAARGFKSGPMITIAGGYPSNHGFHWDYQVTTPAEAQAATTYLLDRGADMIKVALEPWLPTSPWPTLTAEQVQAVVATAHARQIPVRAHVQQSKLLGLALQAGVDTIEHVPLPFPEEAKLVQLQAEDQLSLADYPDLKAQLAYMAEQQISLVPTLSVGTCATHAMPGLETNSRKKMCDFQLEIVGYFHQLGGKVALGNDYGNPSVERGLPLREMELLLAAGLSPMAVITAGTKHAAQVCGHGDELGTLEPGMLADVLVLESDPLREIEAFHHLHLIMQAGQITFQQ